MLVLSREAGDRIVIGKDITVTVVGIEGNRIKLAIKAPLHKTVLREELHVTAGPAGGEPPSVTSPEPRELVGRAR